MSTTNSTIITTKNGIHQEHLSQNKVFKPTITSLTKRGQKTRPHKTPTPNNTQWNYRPYTKTTITTRIGDSPLKINANTALLTRSPMPKTAQILTTKHINNPYNLITISNELTGAQKWKIKWHHREPEHTI